MTVRNDMIRYTMLLTMDFFIRKNKTIYNISFHAIFRFGFLPMLQRLVNWKAIYSLCFVASVSQASIFYLCFLKLSTFVQLIYSGVLPLAINAPLGPNFLNKPEQNHFIWIFQDDQAADIQAQGLSKDFV
ncbi:hypothetical protein ACJX0J_038042, partial [Zea mays]